MTEREIQALDELLGDLVKTMTWLAITKAEEQDESAHVYVLKYVDPLLDSYAHWTKARGESYL